MIPIRKIHFIVVIISCLVASATYAVEKEEVRIRAGLDLFPSILAADMNIEAKKDPDGYLLLVLVYTKNEETVSDMAGYLAKVQRIRDIPIRVEISDVRSLGRFEKRIPAGLFLAQPVKQNLGDLIEYGRKHEIIVFSPFEGDVENGVLGGIHISDRLLPYINMSAMQSSKIQIKPFFLRVAIRYEK
jgi:hypothetical protein